MMRDRFSRRAFLRRLGCVGAAGLGGGAFLGACGAEEPQEPERASGADAQSASDPCSDVSGLSAEAVRAREQLGYVSETPLPSATCDTCQFWITPDADGRCGGCVILEGPIHPEGYCSSWAPQTEA